jgi:1,4-dihydroxy-2-naphthoyl-CoA hydrolase
MIPSYVTIEKLNEMSKSTLVAHLGILYTTVGSDFIEATMPVNDQTRQPYGILHGGASLALAETLGSVGSHLCIDAENFISVGLEINANHVRSVREGIVTGRATLLHEGKSTHIWDIRIKNETGQLICVSRLTVAVLPKERLK